MEEFRIVVKTSTVVEGAVGWGAVVRSASGAVWELAGPAPPGNEGAMMYATLMGIVEALGVLPRPAVVHVATDVQYIANGFNDSLDRWQQRGWKKKGRGRVAYRELWEQIVHERSRHELSIAWTKLGSDGLLAAELAVFGREGERVFNATPPG
uniref:RNase H type-1 domain-containing protein n=1 Tax=Ectopseudomonas mendocina (strain ymp) TaxID=399739 RepID=A4Y093_ECTM1